MILRSSADCIHSHGNKNMSVVKTGTHISHNTRNSFTSQTFLAVADPGPAKTIFHLKVCWDCDDMDWLGNNSQFLIKFIDVGIEEDTRLKF